MAKPSKAGVTSKTFTVLPTETEAGVRWLNSLTEDIFRDKILADLFRQMQKQGVLLWYENIHGRLDKGVDYLLVFGSDFGRRVIGIQVKSKQITRSESGATLSSIRIKQECEAAMAHEFTVQKDKSRLDNIEVWCSAHITSDAEQEFNAVGSIIKIQIKKAPEIFSLIEKYCPDLLKKVPDCSLTLYVKNKSNPPSKKIKLLGCELHAKRNFLEPQFANTPAGSYKGIKNVNRTLKKKHADHVPLQQIVFGHSHVVINAPELSGKTYLLEHVECLIAEAQSVPIFLTPDDLALVKQTSIHSFIAKRLGFYSPKEIETLSQSVRIFLLVDNIDSVSEENRAHLFASDPNKIKIIGTARSLTPPNGVETNYLVGVNLGSISKFLRSLDVNITDTRSFTDRAHSFISRTLSTSGLPPTPFTISIMLTECQNSAQRFNTPTMGRLIERFVEMQLGSHSEISTFVDFETKTGFLTKLAGRKESQMSFPFFKRELIKFIEAHSHPHSVEHFLLDLRNSGVFDFSDDTSVSWSHPVIKQYYWVKSLLAKNKIEPILKKLRKGWNTTLAALVGSQMKDGETIIDPLLNDLHNIKMPSKNKVLESVKDLDSFKWWESDEKEEERLTQMERKVEKELEGTLELTESAPASKAEPSLNDSASSSSGSATTDPQVELTIEEKRAFKKQMHAIMRDFAENKFHIAYNLASLLVNARNTRTDKKESAIQKIMLSNRRMGDVFQHIIEAVFSVRQKPGVNVNINFSGQWIRLYFLLQITDEMLGDPFFVAIFKRLLRKAKEDEEVLMVLDLVLCCGEDEYDLALKRLQEIGRPDITFALYIRVVSLYFFRFHREKDKTALRSLLKNMRKIEKSISLPAVQ